MLEGNWGFSVGFFDVLFGLVTRSVILISNEPAKVNGGKTIKPAWRAEPPDELIKINPVYFRINRR
jgi:hypothetical protein